MEQMDLFGGLEGRIPPPQPVATAPDMVRVAPGRNAWVPEDAVTPPDTNVLCRW